MAPAERIELPSSALETEAQPRTTPVTGTCTWGRTTISASTTRRSAVELCRHGPGRWERSTGLPLMRRALLPTELFRDGRRGRIRTYGNAGTKAPCLEPLGDAPDRFGPFSTRWVESQSASTLRETIARNPVGVRNWNSPEWAENQQILVARHQAICTTSDGGFQQLVVVRIATDRYCARQFHLHGAEAQIGDEPAAFRIIHILAEFRSRE